MSNDWITDRRPTKENADAHGYVWVTEDDGQVFHMMWDCVTDEPWMDFKRPEPYVKPKRYNVEYYHHNGGTWMVVDCESGWAICHAIPTREAAERIAAIYEEVMQ